MEKAWPLKEELELWAHICAYESFYWFCRIAGGIEWNPNNSWFVPRVHKPFCDWYQLQAEYWLKHRRRHNIAGLLFRFAGKTTILTRLGQLWLHVHDTDLATYTGSESAAIAVELCSAMKRTVDGTPTGDPYAWFTALYGNWYDFNREWSLRHTVHAARRGIGRVDASFGIWGVERGLTGKHPDCGFFDDPTSYDLIAAHANWFLIVNDHVNSLLPVFGDWGFLVWPGTRYGDGDHFGTEFRREGIASCAGMLIPDLAREEGGGIPTGPGKKWHVYFLDAEQPDGSPTLPERCSKEFLMEMERSNPVRYWAQMRNDPGRSPFAPVTRELAESLKLPRREVPKVLRHIINLDCAFSSPQKQARGDESIIEHHGHTVDGTGRVYFLEGVSSTTWNVDEFLEQLVIMVQQMRARGEMLTLITDDRESGGHEGSWEQLLRNRFHEAGLHFPEFRPMTRQGRSKATRMSNASGFWRSGLVWIVDKAPGSERLIDQMIRVGTAMDHDDWVDAHSDNFADEVYHGMHLKATDKEPKRAGFAEDPILKPTAQITTQDLLNYIDREETRHEGYGYEPV